MKDITDEKDVILLVDAFYDRVKNNPDLSYIFNEVDKINWDHHLPAMYSFWSTVLFGKGNYKGNPMIKHMVLNGKFKLTNNNFKTWLSLFNLTVDEHFKGLVADEAKLRAVNIARLLFSKMNSSEQINF